MICKTKQLTIENSRNVMPAWGTALKKNLNDYNTLYTRGSWKLFKLVKCNV